MPINHAKTFLKSVHTKTLFLEPFSQIFEQLFVNGEAFLKKLFSEKSFQMVRSSSGYKVVLFMILFNEAKSLIGLISQLML